MLSLISSTRQSILSCLALAVCFATLAASAPAHAEASLVIEADTGKVLFAENATVPWYPASVTKLMTAYVVLKAVKDGRTSLDNLVTVSPIAASQAPSKMGFRAGTQLTVDNAMKMMLVKSANDMAVVLAEGLDGSIEAFADEMNQTALRLGMTQTHFVNPNGLPADGHVSSARDLAILGRALLRDLPEYEYFVHIPAIKFGRRVTRNFNSLIGRYPGADGMKTGFICASGFNLVASATRNNKRLIAVVLGASSSAMRTNKAAQLLERGFSGSGLAWLTPSLGTVNALVPVNVDPPNLRDDVCGPHRKRQAPESDDDNASPTGEGGVSMFAGLQPGQLKPAELLAAAPAAVEPVIVYTGPTRTGAAIIAANAADAAAETPKPKGKRAKGRGKAAQVATAKPDAKPDTKDAAKPAAKPARTAAKPVADKPVTARTTASDKAKTAAVRAEGAKADKKSEKKPEPKRSEAQKPAGKKDSKPVSQRSTDPAPRS